MPKYRKKPVVFDVMQYTGVNGDEINKWSGDRAIESHVLERTEKNPSGLYLQILTKIGMMVAIVGDYVIKIDDEDFYIRGAKTFEETYEEVK